MIRIAPVNLQNMTFFEVKQLSKNISGKTNDQIAEAIGMGHEHVARHFRESDYNLRVPILPALCKALGNDLQIEWQAVQAGGYYGKLNTLRIEETSVDVQMAGVLKEASDVMSVWAQSMLDGHRTREEEERLDKELYEVMRKAGECRKALSLAKMTRH